MSYTPVNRNHGATPTSEKDNKDSPCIINNNVNINCAPNSLTNSAQDTPPDAQCFVPIQSKTTSEN